MVKANEPESGVILTRHARDTQNGIEVSYWLKTAQGVAKVTVPLQQAIFFVENGQRDAALQHLNQQKITVSTKSLTLKTFSHQSVTGFYFNSLRDFYAARSLLKQQNIKLYEDDFRPEDRFLMERFITSTMLFQGDKYQGESFDVIANAQCKVAENNIPLKMTSIDIECSPNGQLYSIGAYSDDCQIVFMIGQPESGAEPYLRWVNDEKALLEQFIFWLNDYDPDVVIGWNVVNFDFNLLTKRCEICKVPFAIGRDGSEPYWRKLPATEQQYMDITGRVVLDGIDVMKNATYNFASFSLENVASELLGKGKKVEDVDNRLQEIVDNFHHNKQALAAYNLEDCKLVWQIFEHAELLSFAQLRSLLTGLTLDRVGGSVAAFTNLYLPKLHRAGYVAPNLGDGRQDLVSPGGHVMDSIPGIYRNVLVLDFKSLYPSIIRTFNIDPMGMVEGLANPEQAITGFDGAFFSREKHFLPEIITQLWRERDKAKADKNAALSQAIKIIMNSFYGVLGSTGCRFFDPRLSGSITKRSHEVLKTTKQWIEQDKGFQVIYGDTDSIFVYVGDENSAEQCAKLGAELSDYINLRWNENIQRDFDCHSFLEIEFETHFKQFFMPTIRGLDVGTKKRYAGLIDKNGQNKLVFKGLESVRTDWTSLAKDFQHQLYWLVFHNRPVDEFVLNTVADTLAGKHDEKLVYRKRIRRRLKDYVKSIPPHVKAARHADELNAKQGRKLQYQSKGWIEYVMTTNGPQTLKHQDAPLDYQFYIDRQLKAVADAILPWIDGSFEQITDNQLSLF